MARTNKKDDAPGRCRVNPDAHRLICVLGGSHTVKVSALEDSNFRGNLLILAGKILAMRLLAAKNLSVVLRCTCQCSVKAGGKLKVVEERA